MMGKALMKDIARYSIPSVRDVATTTYNCFFSRATSTITTTSREEVSETICQKTTDISKLGLFVCTSYLGDKVLLLRQGVGSPDLLCASMNADSFSGVKFEFRRVIFLRELDQFWTDILYNG